ncbi:glycosyltransferase family 2 protein [Nonomuraea sp. GTA35]|uniref:glycosyltransferase family 2 protein n=1 Tax=Nonomuraea sp. GTA35 TaxID=1676746 RepID=UPI0035BF8DC0
MRPDISVLLPSRGRPQALHESVASLRTLTDKPRRVEVLVAADPDDHDTIAAAEAIDATVWVAPRRYGYAHLHRYVNALAELASGDWLLLWNDDARMLTTGWDSRTVEAPHGVLWPAHNGSPYLNVFPIVHARLVAMWGHFSLSPHCDSWVQDIADAAGIHHHIDVAVLHDRYDLTGGHNDQTYREAKAGYRTSDYHSPLMVARRQRDIDILRTAQEARL